MLIVVLLLFVSLDQLDTSDLLDLLDAALAANSLFVAVLLPPALCDVVPGFCSVRPKGSPTRPAKLFAETFEPSPELTEANVVSPLPESDEPESLLSAC